jgi:hypothetical protein
LLQERGYVVERLANRFFLATPRYSHLGVAGRTGQPLIVGLATTDADKEFRKARRIASDAGRGLLFVTFEPLEEDTSTATVLDALDLEAMFFPMYVEHSVDGLIVAIRESFVQRLIPRSDQAQFLTPTRVQLRTENVYYRYPSGYAGLTRGSPLFFYETQRTSGQSRLIGEAKLVEHAVDTPRELLGQFGHLGVYSLKDLEDSTKRKGAQAGKALALKFDWYREMEQPLSSKQVREILPNFNPITARRIRPLDVLELRRAAGWNVTPLSFQ